ncbi:hypothetical protein PVK06_031736 [Gossypium arboreum]|uniref:Uncharacterized protein n=1 Tax=Gossypium arboreum TaxID=29729 RepID=A0ABR0NRU8_GOSAR|nr:hypothetical protein PVK06_031736 [Gossypium arboreum]
MRPEGCSYCFPPFGSPAASFSNQKSLALLNQYSEILSCERDQLKKRALLAQALPLPDNVIKDPQNQTKVDTDMLLLGPYHIAKSFKVGTYMLFVYSESNQLLKFPKLKVLIFCSIITPSYWV